MMSAVMTAALPQGVKKVRTFAITPSEARNCLGTIAAGHVVDRGNSHHWTFIRGSGSFEDLLARVLMGFEGYGVGY